MFLPKAVADGSLFELDAASFSMVLAQDKLVVASESAVLEHALRWASRAGRTEEGVRRVMPLVRFPLVSLLRLSAALKRLPARLQRCVHTVGKGVHQASQCLS